MAVPPHGYRWWYVDALSDDGAHGLTLIAFVGSVFSPYYAWARRKGMGDPENHCALNVALYGRTRRWAMTERGRRHVTRTPTQFTIGPSALRWAGNRLTFTINETCAPLPFPLRGEVQLTLPRLQAEAVALDDKARHHWQLVAPDATITVEFEKPGLSWKGSAYHDMNWGDEPLEEAFRFWTWARVHAGPRADVLYDVERRDGSRLRFGRSFENGVARPRALPPAQALKRGFWGMAREAPSEGPARLVTTLEDAPFYTRNLVEVGLDGAVARGFHESLSLDRFRLPLVQAMLPFRMPRRG